MIKSDAGINVDRARLYSSLLKPRNESGRGVLSNLPGSRNDGAHNDLQTVNYVGLLKINRRYVLVSREGETR